MVGKNGRVSETSLRFTRLEAAVLAALALDQSAIAPDLAEQTRKSHAGRRLNTAFGYYVEVQTDRGRQYAPAGATGRFGTVHAMIAGLAQSVCFQIELFQGRLIGIYADSYGQDTRSVDFMSAHFTDLFRLDGSGRSVPVQMPSLAPEPKRASPADPSAPVTPTWGEALTMVKTVVAQQAGADRIASQASQGPLTSRAAATRTHAETTAREKAGAQPQAAQLDLEDTRKSLMFGIWTAIGAVALFLVLAFNVPAIVAGIIAFIIGRTVRDPRILDAIAASLKKAQEQQALKMASIRSKARS